MSASCSDDSVRRSISADEFVTLLVRCERRVRAFVATLHPHSHDVEEIVQNACLVAWKKCHTFEYAGQTPNEEFARWLCTIARYEVSNFRRTRGHSALAFDESLMDRLAEQYFHESVELEARHQVLMDCLSRLRPRDQEIVKKRYQGGVSARELARFAGRTVDAIYKSLTRIRAALLICIERSLDEEVAR